MREAKQGFVFVWDRRTGKKLAAPVPKAWLELFPHLSLTPRQKRRTKKSADAPATNAEVKGTQDTTPKTDKD